MVPAASQNKIPVKTIGTVAVEIVAEITMEGAEAGSRTVVVMIPDLNPDSIQDHLGTAGKPVVVKKKRISERGIHIIMNALLPFYGNLGCYGLTNL